MKLLRSGLTLQIITDGKKALSRGADLSLISTFTVDAVYSEIASCEKKDRVPMDPRMTKIQKRAWRNPDFLSPMNCQPCIEVWLQKLWNHWRMISFVDLCGGDIFLLSQMILFALNVIQSETSPWVTWFCGSGLLGIEGGCGAWYWTGNLFSFLHISAWHSSAHRLSTKFPLITNISLVILLIIWVKDWSIFISEQFGKFLKNVDDNVFDHIALP